MLLSIGMIVKNEEKYLRKCLEGLKPILDNVSSELIIFDTGSTDKTIEIAKGFTDKVFEVEWRNDFAHARNQTLAKSTGKWYMFLDADEIFVDTDEIIHFFNSGEFREYKSASFVLKNLVADGKSPSTSEATRLVQKSEETIFVGKIHEMLQPLLSPVKRTKSIANHYGYFFETEEERNRKTNRNLPLLLEVYASQDEKHPLTIIQIANEYRNISNLDEMDKFVDEGLELVGRKPSDIFYHAFVAYKAEILFRQENWDGVINCVRDYFDGLSEFYRSSIAMWFFQANAFARLGNYKEAGDASVKSFKLFEKNKRDGLRATHSISVSLSDQYLTDEHLHRKGIVGNYLLAKEFDTAFEWMNAEIGNIREYFLIFIEYAFKNEGDGLTDLYAYIIKRTDGEKYSKILIDIIEEISTNKDIEIAIAKIFVESKELADCQSEFMQLQRLRAGEMVDTPSPNQTEAQNIQMQIEQQIAGFKSAIYEMINTGLLSQATDMLNVLEGLVPDDSDIKIIRKAINDTH
ncbi:MAG: glycosyltransferase family 2 protein [Defluviitaleaceae bacterium]|nr:glycosyltransferase family 2 protein [Defluviitaleaceae bacterium]